MINHILVGIKQHNINIIKLLFKILYILLLNHLFLHHVFVFYYLGSSDKTLQIVDMRVKSYNKSQLLINAHDNDVNVCDWNKIATNLIVTASDDCSVKVWDLKYTK